MRYFLYIHSFHVILFRINQFIFDFFSVIPAVEFVRVYYATVITKKKSDEANGDIATAISGKLKRVLLKNKG